MTRNTFNYQSEKSEFDETIPSSATTTCDDELTLEEIIATFEKHLTAVGYVFPDGVGIGLVWKE
jgi:hypothetical protein